MFDLDSRVDLDKVVSVLLIDEELARPGVSVVDRFGKFQSVGKDAIADGLIEMRCRGDFDDLKSQCSLSCISHLLMTPLDGAVPFK